MADVATKEPSSVVAGDTFTWKRSLTDYPADDGWTLSYTLRKLGAAANPIEFSASADGSDHLVEVAASVTEDFPSGRYVMQGYAAKALSRFTVYQGFIDIVANLATETNFDPRTHAQKCLDQIEVVLEKRSQNEIISSNFEGAQWAKHPTADLLLLRDRYREEVAREKGGGKGKKIAVHFVKP